MAVESSAELLSFCQTMSGLPTTNEEMDSTKWYMLLELSQKELFRMLSAHVPDAMMGAPVKLTTGDGGYTYNFAAFPWGRVEVRESRTGVLLRPGAEFDLEADFVIEGDSLRWTNKRQRTFEDGPYARYATEPGTLGASNQPTLEPASARVYIGWRALEMWAARGNLRDPSFYARELQKGLWGDPMTPGYIGIIPALKTRFLFQSGVDGPVGYRHYWQAPELGNHYLT